MTTVSKNRTGGASVPHVLMEWVVGCGPGERIWSARMPGLNGIVSRSWYPAWKWNAILAAIDRASGRAAGDGVPAAMSLTSPLSSASLPGARQTSAPGEAPMELTAAGTISGSLEEMSEFWDDPLQRFAKRSIDLSAALLALIVLSPLLLTIGLIIRLTSRGPALFRQSRLGRHGRPFTIYKFRTMVVDAEQKLSDLEHLNESDGGVLFKMKRDPRITRIGALLRRTSLDELPQLWNILRGEMSLVGPRPLQVRDSLLLAQIDSRAYAQRLSVLPGLTGLWQARGRSDTGFEHMLRMDREYIRRWSIGLDLQIIVETALSVARGEGAC